MVLRSAVRMQPGFCHWLLVCDAGMFRFGIVVVSGLAASLWSVLEAQETHPFSVHDMLAMERLSDPQMSPDGSVVAFTVRSTDLAANRGRTDLWSAPVEGGEAHRLTTHEAADFHPRWAPDGRDLFFLSTRSGSSQVWRLPLAGGEPRQVTDLPLDVGNLVVSPGGPPDCAGRWMCSLRARPSTARRDASRTGHRGRPRESRTTISSFATGTCGRTAGGRTSSSWNSTTAGRSRGSRST